MNLLERIQAYCPDVWGHPTWATNTNAGRNRAGTIGLLIHWDAIRGTASDSLHMGNNQYGGILYHCRVRRDGNVRLYSQRYTYHAGRGRQQTLDAFRARQAPSKPTASQTDNTSSGNAWLVAIVVDYYPGDVMSEGQYRGLVGAVRAMKEHFGLVPNQIADHAHYSSRKADVTGRGYSGIRLWDGSTIDLERIRTEIEEDEVDPELLQFVKDMKAAADDRGSNGWFVGPSIDLLREVRSQPLHRHPIGADKTITTRVKALEEQVDGIEGSDGIHYGATIKIEKA